MNPEELDSNAEPVVEEQGTDLFSFDQPTTEDPVVEEQLETDANEEFSEESVKEPSQDAQPKKLSPEQAYQALQSEKDKLAFEAQKAKQELEEYRIYSPLIKYMQENPQVIETLGQSLVKKPEAKASETLQRPEKPTKPANYSRYEANNDPDSGSAKYLDALEEYREQMEDYAVKSQEQKLSQIESEIQKDKAARQQQALLSEVNNVLVTKYGFTGELAKEFIKDMSNPEPTLDELVTLFKVKKKMGNLSKEELAKRAALAKAKVSPAPVAAAGGVTEPPSDDGELFQRSLGFSRRSEADIFSYHK